MDKFAGAEKFRFPGGDERTVVIGRTGCGKTTLAMMLLSEANFDEMPWIVFDTKGEEFFAGLETRGHAKLIALGEMPDKPGLYIVRPVPGRDDIAVETFLWKLWERENIGIVVDELYMIDPRSDAFQAILTQGRSKRMPMINLTQRPVAVSRFNFSESSHIVVFHLNHLKDRQTVAEHMPIDKNTRLMEYHARWYDVNRDKLFLIAPVPDKQEILARFDERLKPPEGEAGLPERIIL